MKRTIKKSFLLVSILALNLWGEPSYLYAAGTSSSQFLKMGAGARAASMGNTATSLTTDVTSTYWNPAGLRRVKKPQVSLMQNNGIFDTQYRYIGAALPFQKNTLGLAFYNMDFGQIDRFTSVNTRSGKFKAASIAGSLSLARSLKKNLFLGITFKFLEEKIEREKASGYATDFGLLYKKGLFDFGVALQHIGPSLRLVSEEFRLPRTLRIGSSARIGSRLLAGVDFSKPIDNEWTYHGGFEYMLNKTFLVRGGYQATPENRLDLEGIDGITTGIGLYLGVIQIDYAVVPFGQLGTSHQFSLLFQPHQKIARKKKIPQERKN